MSRDDGSLRSLVRSPRHTGVCRTYRPLPTDTGLAAFSRHARFEALLPPGVRSATIPIPGQAGTARRCSPEVLALQSSLHHGSGSGMSRRHTRGAKAPYHVHLRAPSRRGCRPRPGLRRLSSRAQDPSIRRVYRTLRITVRQRPSSPSVSRTLSCASRQHRPAPCRAFENGASCPCPLFGGTPRLPALGDRIPREGAPTAGPRRRCLVEPCTRPCPSRGRLATEPLAELDPVARSPTCAGCRVDPSTTGFRHSHPIRDPYLARCGSVVGPPVARWAGSLGFQSLVDPAPGCERASSVGLYASRTDPCGPVLRALRLGRDTPSPGCHEARSHRLALSRARRTFVRQGVP